MRLDEYAFGIRHDLSGLKRVQTKRNTVKTTVCVNLCLTISYLAQLVRNGIVISQILVRTSGTNFTHPFRVTFDSEFSVFVLKFHCNLPPKNRTIWYDFSYYSTIFQIALNIVYIRVCKDNL